MQIWLSISYTNIPFSIKTRPAKRLNYMAIFNSCIFMVWRYRVRGIAQRTVDIRAYGCIQSNQKRSATPLWWWGRDGGGGDGSSGITSRIPAYLSLILRLYISTWNTKISISICKFSLKSDLIS